MQIAQLKLSIFETCLFSMIGKPIKIGQQSLVRKFKSENIVVLTT